MNKRKAQLLVRLSGPGVREGRILLRDLVKFGRDLESALNRVAVTMRSSTHDAGEPVSVRSAVRAVRPLCSLEVVAMESGSFQLGLDIHRDPEPLQGAFAFETDAKLGEEALGALIEGLDGLGTASAGLPRGYDLGVLAAWRDTARLFDHGIERVEFDLDTPTTGSRKAVFDDGVLRRVVTRIQGPVTKLRTIEGRLLMADFKAKPPKCRVHPQTGDPVRCEFDEALSEVVKEHLRAFVRVTGEAQEENSGKVLRLRVADIEPLSVATDVGSLDADEFWEAKSVEQLAAEQGIEPVQDLLALVGSASSLWGSDEDFERFVAGIYERRHETGEDHR